MSDSGKPGAPRPRRGIPADEEVFAEPTQPPVDLDDTAVIPRARRSAQSPSEVGEWKNVPKSGGKPPLPLWVKTAGIGAVVALLVLAAWLGSSLGGGHSPGNPTQSSEQWELKLPQQVGDYIAGIQSSPSQLTPASQTPSTLVSSEYSNGSEQIVVQLMRPAPDLPEFLKYFEIVDAVEVGQASCGTIDGKSTCVRILDSTAVVVSGKNDQTPDALAPLVDQFYSAVSGK